MADHDYNNDSADSAEEESSDSEGELCKTPKVDTTRRCCFAAANRRKTMDAVIAEMEHEPPSETKLSLIDLLCIGVGSTVGSGVFVLTGDVLPVAGPSASLSWIFAGAACLLSGFAYMELSARLPTRGSCYTFSYHGLGELWAVIGAFCITLEYGVSGAGVARNWSRKMGNFLGEDYKHVVFFYFGKGTWAANATAAELDDPYARTDHNYMDLSAAFLTAGCTLLLMGGLSLSKAVVNLMTLMKVLLVIFMVICGFLGASQNIFESGEVFAPGGISGVVNATTLLFFGFIGFDEVCCLSSKAKNASRTMPLALIGTLGIAALAISLISEPGKSSDFGTAFADKGWTVVSWIVCLGELILLPLVVLLSILPQPEVSATMATDRLIPSIFRKQSSDGTFVWGLALTGLIALVALALACPFSILWNGIRVHRDIDRAFWQAMPKKNFPPKVGDGRFEVQDKLGEGCFGAVFLGKDKKSDSPVAVKFEDSQCGAPGSLAMENSLLKQLGEPQRPQGFAEVFFFGKVGSFTCMVMDLLGKSLEECMEVCQGKMEPSSVVLIAEQALRRIEYLHSKGVVHRDIKPENFMYGRGGKIHHLHLIDFGLSDTYWGRRHVSQSNGNSMVGTARYCSVNTHKGINQTRRDDLEAIAHMLIYFLRGALPWSGLKGAKTEKEKYEMIGKRKESFPLDDLCAGMPNAFKFFLSYSRSLPFLERPDYERLSHIFQKAREELEIKSDHALQWLDETTISSDLVPLEPYASPLQPDDKVIVEDSQGRCFPFLWRLRLDGEGSTPPAKDSE